MYDEISLIWSHHHAGSLGYDYLEEGQEGDAGQKELASQTLQSGRWLGQRHVRGRRRPERT